MNQLPSPILRSIGTAVPENVIAQDLIGERLARCWNLNDAQQAKWCRILEGSAVEKRHTAIEPEDILNASTGERMRAYARHAPALGIRAAQIAIDRAAIEPSDVTHLLAVSCTGFAAPGFDIALVDDLGLRPGVHRTMIGFMGCFGALIALRSAIDICNAHKHAVVIICCVELSSVHARNDTSANNMVGAALFGDGAASAVLTSAETHSTTKHDPCVSFANGHSLLTTDQRDRMTWTIGDRGFEMKLAPDLPRAIRKTIEDAPMRAPRHAGLTAVHPGGPRILRAVEDAFGYTPGALRASRHILRQFGNMSSPTVLFVLDHLLDEVRRDEPDDEDATSRGMLCAFGPGLSVETIDFNLSWTPIARSSTPIKTMRTAHA